MAWRQAAAVVNIEYSSTVVTPRVLSAVENSAKMEPLLTVIKCIKRNNAH